MTPRASILIKLSGDGLLNSVVLEWIKLLSTRYYMVVCVGGGTQINEAFRKAGLPIRKFGPGMTGRPTRTFEERQLARDVLEKNQVEVQEALADIGANMTVVIPVIEVGGVLCHINGDLYVLLAYQGFQATFIVTNDERLEEKRASFEEYAKIQVASPQSLPNLKKIDAFLADLEGELYQEVGT